VEANDWTISKAIGRRTATEEEAISRRTGRKKLNTLEVIPQILAKNDFIEIKLN
jgi:hypothetical protein